MCAFLPLRKINLLFSFLLLGIAGVSFTEINTPFSPLAVVPTDTVTVCGSSTTLNTTTVPGYANPIWNDGTTGTSLTVNSSGDYWWQVTGTTIVVNGDFSAANPNTAGNRGFTSSYSYKKNDGTSPCNSCCCGILSIEGTYTITTNPRNVHTNFTSMADHTNGSGNMLVVNGAAVANTTVWTENITVTPNTDYVFSTWIASVNPQNPALLQFSINGSPLGSTITASAVDGIWQYYTTTWNSGSGGTFPIALVNQNISTNGNDFAVDDIVFAPVYRKNIHVVLNPIPVLALTGPNAACGSYDLTQTIVGYNTSTYNYFFKDSNGNTVTPPVSQSGNYTITEQNKTTGCTSLPVQTTVTIKPNPPKPGISSL